MPNFLTFHWFMQLLPEEKIKVIMAQNDKHTRESIPTTRKSCFEKKILFNHGTQQNNYFYHSNKNAVYILNMIFSANQYNQDFDIGLSPCVWVNDQIYVVEYLWMVVDSM